MQMIAAMRRFLILIAMFSCSPLASAAELRDLRLWDSPDSTRVVFDINGAVEHKVFALSNPDRVVIDISGLDSRSAALVSKAVAKGVVQKLRSGPRDERTIRVVLDVSKPVDPKSFSIQPNGGYGYRLVVDLYGKSPATQAAEPVASPNVRRPRCAWQVRFAGKRRFPGDLQASCQADQRAARHEGGVDARR
jgi:N-acetylmuramoyl-L-alanine amidase